MQKGKTMNDRHVRLPTDRTVAILAYMLALLSETQRWEVASCHAALLRSQGRFYSTSVVFALYDTLAQQAQPTLQEREVGR
jgi:hypothetical protein